MDVQAVDACSRNSWQFDVGMSSKDTYRDVMTGRWLICKILCCIVSVSALDACKLEKSTLMTVRPCLSHHDNGRQRQMPMQTALPIDAQSILHLK